MRRGRAGVGPLLGAALLALAVGTAACSGSGREGVGRDGAATAADRTTERVPTSSAAPRVTAAPATSATYSQPGSWLCLPGRSAAAGDACDVDLDATLVAADGSTRRQPHRTVADPPVDCFYVYPTVSRDAPPNADRVAGEEERTAARLQFARFGEVCRTFAPLYRQVPLAGLSALGTASTTTVPGTPDPWEVAYADVLEAWRYYVAELNPGPDGQVRPFVLIGHSQGAGHLRRLVAQELDGPEHAALRSRLVGALLIGSGVPAPGSPGAFADVPPCTSPTQRGCVVSYASFAADAPPPENSYFGAPRSGPGRVVCTNPAALGGGAAPLDTYLPAPEGGPGVTTPSVRYQGLVTGECVRDGRFDYLRITPDRSADDARPADLGGRITPPWGLHLIDVNLAQGDLVDLVRTRSGG